MNDSNEIELTPEFDMPESHELRDIVADTGVGVEIGTTGHKLWVCVDGQCVLRVQAPEILLTDRRETKWMELVEVVKDLPLTFEDEGLEFLYDLLQARAKAIRLDARKPDFLESLRKAVLNENENDT